MDASSSFVDVIIPVRNRPRLVRDAIRSVQRQDHRRLRVLVVDDRSTDETPDVVREMRQADPRVLLLVRDSGEGEKPAVPAARARQFGLGFVEAPFVAILDSDDVWEPQKLRLQLTEFSEFPATDVVLCGHQWVDADGTSLRPPRMPVVSGRASPTISNNMSTPVFRTESLVRTGGFWSEDDEPYTNAEHFECYIRWTHSLRFRVVEEVLVRCRSHPGERASSSLGDRASADGLSSVIRRHRDWLQEHPDEFGRLLALAGARYLDAGDSLAGLQHLARGIRQASFARKWTLTWKYLPFTLLKLGRRLLGNG